MSSSNYIEKSHIDPVFKKYGMTVYANEFIEIKRNEKPRDQNFIAPQAGGQEILLTSEADIVIFGGVRGGGKSGGLMLGVYDYIDNPGFSGVIFRKEKDDARKSGGIIQNSTKFYSGLGLYNKSEQDRTWYFSKGGRLNFGYYSDSIEEFIERYQGVEYSYIGIDEITHMKYPYFKYLLTCNRNSYGLKNKIIGTCNPDPDSWVARFIGGEFTCGTNQDGSPIIKRKWIKDDGYPDPNMDGKILYCYMWGDREDQIYWGETKEQVYEQAKDKIDRVWNDKMSKSINKTDIFLSVAFIAGKLEDNKILLENDSSYYRNLVQQSDERRLRDLEGNWTFKSYGDGLLSPQHIDDILANTQQRTGIFYATADIATTGGDAAVVMLWDGFHCFRVESYKTDSATLLTNIEQLLEKYGIPQENFCYDDAGIGKYLEGFMPKAIRFVGNLAPTDKTAVKYGNITQNISRYANLRAQCVDLFCDRVKTKGYSFDSLLLGRYFFGKRLRDHIKEEYISLRQDNNRYDKFKIIDKAEMKAIIGHSPDFIDALYMREYIELIKKNKCKQEGLWMI